MSDETTLPEDDRDLILARRIGERLDAAHTLPAARDAAVNDASFYSALLASRSQILREREAPDADFSRRTWSRIAATTRGREDRPAQGRGSSDRAEASVRAWVWWGAAAGLLLAGFVYLLLHETPDPSLLASTGSDIGRYEAPDGSMVTLRPHSALFLMEESESGIRYRLTGEGFFDIAERPERRFTVRAGSALITVLGTRFNVSTWGEEASVFLEEGHLLFEHASSGASVVLIPGQASRTDGSSVRTPVLSSAHEHMDWLNIEMRFEQRPVRRVLAELEQHYALTIRAPDSLLDQTLSGRILLEDAQQSLEDLGQVMGGRFEKQRRKTYRFETE